MTSTKQLVKLIIADSYRPLWQVLKIYAGIMVLVAVAVIHAQWGQSVGHMVWTIVTQGLIILGFFYFVYGLLALKQAVLSWQDAHFVLLPVSKHRFFTINLLVRFLVPMVNAILYFAMLLVYMAIVKPFVNAKFVGFNPQNVSEVMPIIGKVVLGTVFVMIGLFLLVNIIGLAANLGMSRFLSVSSHWANVAITAMVLFIGLAVFSVVMSASVDFLSPMVGDAEWLDTVVAIVLYVLMVAGIYGLFAKFNDAK
ncbi:hypothetical protein [Weissella cibaria]|uniref:hypothetical protein n=1 Tax=Weissella cibaria TaxID=137591 RepID=UPI001194B5CE|nr:hypothetical protein [Weissella cibaria]MCS8560720.1 hypothetical protein [Weissella cibaria]MCS8565240.1 hypothetical protein [Weissella cibaria]MCS8575739.1 hypothetical protein [Weissella cibaria]MCT0000119.1 hypothetical protein [Weissella cibaria]TVV39155.1 hypothetical protein FO437_10900 [Weissella cibaria]